MNVSSVEQRGDMIHFAQLVADYGLVPNTQGNISIRDPETDLILITPHDLPYGTMKPDDLVVVSPEGEQIFGQGTLHSKCLYTVPSIAHVRMYRYPTYGAGLREHAGCAWQTD